MVDAVRDAGMESRTTIQSFDWRTLSDRAAHRAGNRDRRADRPATGRRHRRGRPARSVAVARRARCRRLRRLGAEARPRERGPRVVSELSRTSMPALVEEAHALGLAVVPWTVNEPHDMAARTRPRRRRDDQRPTRPAAVRARVERHRLAPGRPRPMIGWLRPAPFAAPLPAGARRSELPAAAPPRVRRHLHRLRGLLPGPQQPRARDPGPAAGAPGVHARRQLGTALTGLSIAYGVSKFLMGSVSDRSNPKYFLPLGLLLSSAIMAAFGLFDAASTRRSSRSSWSWRSTAGCRAWAGRRAARPWCTGSARKSAGSPSRPGTSRTTSAARWSRISRSSASCCSTTGARSSTSTRSSPRSSPWSSASCSRTRRSRAACRRSSSTRTIFRRAIRECARADARRSGEIFLEHVLPNRYLWAIAVANAFCYFVRYGVVNWIPTYLETAKGFSFQQSSIAWSLYEYAAIPGTIACGWISDRWFKGRRAPTTMLFMALTLVAVHRLLAQPARAALDRLRGADRDRLPRSTGRS